MASVVCETSSAPSRNKSAVWRLLVKQDTVTTASRQAQFCFYFSVAYVNDFDAMPGPAGFSVFSRRFTGPPRVN